MKRVMSHWTMPFPEATRKILRLTCDDPVVRVHAVAGQSTLHVTRDSGAVFYAVCPSTEARDIERAVFRGEDGGDTRWIEAHRVDVQRMHGVLLTVTVAVRIREYQACFFLMRISLDASPNFPFRNTQDASPNFQQESIAANAISYAVSYGTSIVIALSGIPEERAAFARSAGARLVDMLPAIRDSRGDIFRGLPPSFHAVIAGTSIQHTVGVHGCRAAVFDDLHEGDVEAILRMSCSGVMCILACSATDSRTSAIVQGCRSLAIRVIAWDIGLDRVV